MPSLARCTASAIAIVVSLASGTAQAEDVVDVCANASEQAQSLRDEGELVAAKRALITCAASRCPEVVRADCTTWLAEVEEALPTVVLAVRDAGGEDVAGATVRVDGADRPDATVGRAFAIDPGPRKLEIALPDGTSVVENLVVREGEKARPVTITLGGEAPLEESGGLVVPTGAWILAGVAVVGGGLFTGLAVHAQSEVDDMRATCAPNCPADRVDDAQRALLAGNVSLGLGLAALGAAVTWTLVATLTGDAEPPPVTAGPFGLLVRF